MAINNDGFTRNIEEEAEEKMEYESADNEYTERDKGQNLRDSEVPEDRQGKKVKEGPIEGEEIEESKESEGLESLNNKLKILQADYLNLKARYEKDKLTTYGNAVSDVICDLLPVVDNLERAIAAENSETDSFKEGVVMVYQQLMGIMDKKGLKEIEALHKPFDHNLHYGVAFEECEDYDDGIIIDVLQKGYTVNDKLIRPSMVRICKK